jgi:hypothetical protein
VAVVAAPHAAAVGVAVPDALVVAPVPAVGAAAAPDAAAAAMEAVEPEAAAAEVAPDAVVAVAGSAAAAAFSLSPFPDLLEALGRSQARPQMAWRVLIRAPQPTRSCRPTATLLFWTSANDFTVRSKFVPDESVPTGAHQIRSIDSRMGQ